MADETEGHSHASSHFIAQGTPHPTAPSSTRGRNENNPSAIPPNALPSQPRPDPPPEPPAKATSQSMVTSLSSSSAPSAQHTHAMDTNGPSPYGTRSRNRTGTSRPNYAEDRELDTEYEWSSTKKLHTSLATSAAAQMPSADGERLSGISTRRSSTTASTTPINKQAGINTPKEQIPGMSSFSLNTEIVTSAPPQSRKRKAPGSHVTSSAANGGDQAANLPRKQASIATMNCMWETNMMSFEGSQAYLKDGKLVADDGTTLEVNGMVHCVRQLGASWNRGISMHY